MRKIEVQKTSDGSSTLYLPEMDEHYHSTNGALTESLHVFIKTGLEAHEKSELSVLEIGFGTGLNAMLTLKAADRLEKCVSYSSIELYPLSKELVDSLDFGFDNQEDKANFNKLHDAEWNSSVVISERFVLKKIHGDLTKTVFEDRFDLVYFDAFAPDKQPDMWREEIFRHIYEQMNEGGIFVTYCAKGVVRRMLQAVGFTTERLPGPPGKREMLRARKL